MNLNESIEQSNDFAADQTEKLLESLFAFEQTDGEASVRTAILLIASNMLSILYAEAESKKEKDTVTSTLIKLAEIKASDVNLNQSH